jgi:hypothetical protein
MTGTRRLTIITIVSLVMLVTGCLCTNPDEEIVPPDGMQQVSKQESIQIAEQFIINSPTFAFDGIPESLILKETFTARCSSCWAFIFEFQCSSAGYGNRSGQEVAAVVTTHTATIAMEQGKITSAELDGEWDMREQKPFE